MYETINDVPEVIKDFFYEETINEPTGEMIEGSYEAETYDPETGEPTGETETRTRQVPEMHDVIYVRQIVRPEFKALADVERLISLGKPKAVLDIFAELAAQGYQWSWFDLYVTYQAELASYQEAQAAFEPVTDEEGNISEFTGLAPTEPVRPALIAAEQLLIGAKGHSTLVKNRGAELLGEKISLNESNQNGVAAVLTGLALAESEGVDMFPLSFKAETLSGVVSMPFTDIAGFKSFALQFMGARQAFFK